MYGKRRGRLLVGLGVLLAVVVPASWTFASSGGGSLDRRLAQQLEQAGFTGRAASSLEPRLGRRLDRRLADPGRLHWFDTITGLNGDNTCAGCHSPTNGFGDTQSIAIGIENNRVVGPRRVGPRNERRAPTVLNTAFFPRLMWNGRFASLSDDPFNNSSGFLFPEPEGTSLSYLPHLLTAQAFIPPTERVEVAGFGFPGDNDAIRAEVLRRLDDIPAYRRLLGRVFPAVEAGAPITFDEFGAAIAEFEFSLSFADAPIDRFARGNRGALSKQEKRARCSSSARPVACNATARRAARPARETREAAGTRAGDAPQRSTAADVRVRPRERRQVNGGTAFRREAEGRGRRTRARGWPAPPVRGRLA